MKYNQHSWTLLYNQPHQNHVSNEIFLYEKMNILILDTTTRNSWKMKLYQDFVKWSYNVFFAKPALSHKGVNQITAKTYTQKERKNWDTSKNEWWKNHNPIVNWLYVKKGYTYLLIPIDWILFIHPSPEYKKINGHLFTM
jgi:hypothetical protein